jgi:hypothetical protein
MAGRQVALLLLAMIALQIAGFAATLSISGILVGEAIGLAAFAVFGWLEMREARQR